jgi:hypothetical protein
VGFGEASLLVIAGFLLPFYFLKPKSLTVSDIVDKKTRATAIMRWEILRWSAIIGIPIQILVVLQGFHLIQIGYAADFGSVSPEHLGQIAGRGGGRGGIILLVIYFLPYFLIAGYSWVAWNTYSWLRIGNQMLKRLRYVDNYVEGASHIDHRGFQDGLRKMAEKYPKTDPTAGAYALCKAMMERSEDSNESNELNLDLSEKSAAAWANSGSAIQMDFDNKNLEQTEQELCKIDKLRQKGLISDDEHRVMRRKILGL